MASVNKAWFPWNGLTRRLAVITGILIISSKYQHEFRSIYIYIGFSVVFREHVKTSLSSGCVDRSIAAESKECFHTFDTVFSHHIESVYSRFQVYNPIKLFGIGYGIFDTNNMPILCQFVSSRQRATAYGVMNMAGVFSGAAVTHMLGSWSDNGNLGAGFAILAAAVAVALCAQLYFLRPGTDNME